MARPFRIGCPGALYRDLERVGLRLVTQYLAKKWEDEYGLFEVAGLLCAIWRSRLESSRTTNVFPSWLGSFRKVIVQNGDGHDVSM